MWRESCSRTSGLWSECLQKMGLEEMVLLRRWTVIVFGTDARFFLTALPNGFGGVDVEVGVDVST